ncbi:hypothetical protein M8494_06970 [Serratia ureilytica]
MKDEIQAGLIKIKNDSGAAARRLAGRAAGVAGRRGARVPTPPAPDAVISSERQAADPAEFAGLGGAPDDAAREKQWAEMASSLAKRSE